MKPILLLFFSLFLAGTAFSQEADSLNYDTVLAKVNANQPAYKTANIRAKMTWADANGEQDFQANIRMVKDSLVWMSLSAMGIEGARALLTPDSIRVINKLTNEYLVRDFSYVQSWLLLPVNFKMFQQIFTGQKLDIGDNAAKAISTEDSLPVLYTETDKLQEKIKVDLINYTVSKILLKDKLLKQDMSITFDGYKNEQGRVFAYQRDIQVNRDSATMQLKIDISKLRWDEDLTFPFEISDKYKRVE